MNSNVSLLPQLIRHWSFQFFMSMGAVLSVATALTVGVVLTHWIYICARGIEAKPTSSSLSKTILRLSGFQALVAGAILVPVIIVGLFYLLSSFLWKILPSMPSTPSVDISPPGFDSLSADEWFSGMVSLIIYLAALTATTGGAIFFLLRHYAKGIDMGKGSTGLIKTMVRRYFHESVLVGLILILIACPVIWFFLYNVASLGMLIYPRAALELPKIAFTGADHLYLVSLRIISSWLIVILFLPAALLLLRGLRLRFRYTMENLTMNVIFKRSVKLFSLGFFGFVGCALMQLLADSLFKVIAPIVFR